MTEGLLVLVQYVLLMRMYDASAENHAFIQVQVGFLAPCMKFRVL